MTQLWLKLFDAARSRQWVLPGVLLLLLGLAALGAARLTFSEDILDLLPQDDEQVQESRDALKQFPTLERIIIALESDDRDLLVQSSDEAVARLEKLEGISSIISRVDEEVLADILEIYDGRLPLFFDEIMEREVNARLTPGHFQQRYQSYLDRKAGAEGIDIGRDNFRQDPYDLQVLLQSRFERLNSGFRTKLDSEGRLLSRDERFVIFFCEADSVAMDTGRGRELMAGIDEALAALPPEVTSHVVGAHRSSVDNANVLRDDLHLTIATSVAGVVLLFLIAFRALSPILVTLLSVAFGFAMALGTQGWFRGELSAVTVGFAAVLVGISVDYSIHLVTAYARAEGERPVRARLALRRIARPALLAMISTALALGTMRLSQFDGLHQLAEMAVAGIAGALVFALTIGAQLLRRFGPVPGRGAAIVSAVTAIDRLRSGAARPILILCLAITVAAAIFVPRVNFDGDLTRLDGKSAETAASEKLIQEAFGQETLRRTLLITSGDSLDAALRANDLAARTLQNFGVTKFESVAWVLPSLQSQRENLERWRGFWSRERRETIKSEICEAAVIRPDTGETRQLTPSQRDRFFRGFLDSTGPDHAPPLLVAETLRDHPLWALLGNYRTERDGRVYVATTIDMNAERVPELRDRLPDALVLNKAHFAGHMVEFIRRDLMVLGGLSLILVIILLVVTFRRLRDVLIALVPVAGGMIWTLGLMGVAGIPFNIINTLVTVFVAGLGIDYGIFFVQTYREAATPEEARLRLRGAGAGVLVAALTTLFGFGSLALANHPALFSVGITTTVGIAGSLTLTLLVTPTLLEMGRSDAEKPACDPSSSSAP